MTGIEPALGVLKTSAPLSNIDDTKPFSKKRAKVAFSPPSKPLESKFLYSYIAFYPSNFAITAI